MSKSKYEIIHLDSDKSFIELIDKYGGDKPLVHICQIMMANECKTIILEKAPNDQEYKDEYQHVFNRVFSAGTPEEGIGLHFFRQRLKSFSKTELTKYKKEYLGYCFLRPLSKQRVSHAFINNDLVTDVNTKFVYFICEMTKEVEINSVKFEISGFPYIQQDGRSIRCAQAALAITSEYLAKKKKINQSFTGAQITKIVQNHASSTGEKKVPSNGLNISQIGMVMEKMGVEPLTREYRFLETEKRYFIHPEQIIYRYLESGIPVIVGIDTAGEKHALVVVGHTFNPDFWWSHGETLYFDLPHTAPIGHCSTAWIQNFIVQDDNLGPYLFVPARFLQMNTYCIAVPLPKNVFLTGEEAELIANQVLFDGEIKEWITNSIKKLENTPLNDSNLFWLNFFYKKLNERNIIFRTYLKSSEEFEEEINQNNSNNSELISFYQKQKRPEYIWVVEISAPELFCHSRKRLGEIIIDSTADSRFDISYLSIHLPGFIIERNVQKNISVHPILSDDSPYKHLMR